MCKGQHSTVSEMLRFVTCEGKVVELTAGRANVAANNLLRVQRTAQKQAAKGAAGQG